MCMTLPFPLSGKPCQPTRILDSTNTYGIFQSLVPAPIHVYRSQGDASRCPRGMSRYYPHVRKAQIWQSFHRYFLTGMLSIFYVRSSKVSFCAAVSNPVSLHVSTAVQSVVSMKSRRECMYEEQPKACYVSQHLVLNSIDVVNQTPGVCN